jgi:hypothetical protein
MAEPNTSSPSRRGVSVMNKDLKIKLATIVASLGTSLEAWAFQSVTTL